MIPMEQQEVLDRAASFDPTQVPAEAVLKTALKMIVQLHGCDLEMARDIAKLALREVA